MEHAAIVQNICITAAVLACAGGLALLKGALKELSRRLGRTSVS